jgi:hypothetical protein
MTPGRRGVLRFPSPGEDWGRPGTVVVALAYPQSAYARSVHFPEKVLGAIATTLHALGTTAPGSAWLGVLSVGTGTALGAGLARF